jgi:hypothetical protein
MRRFTAALAAAILLLPARAFAQAHSLVMTAQTISLYPDRRLLIARGGVSITIDGVQQNATGGLYDLRANRLMLSSGYVYDFKKQDASTQNDVSIPQYSAAEALAIGQEVQIDPGVSITFSNASVRSGTDSVPAASYTYAIPSPSAKNYGYSPVPSAALEWPVLVSSGADGYTYARLRYDKYNGGPGTGTEEHFAASDRGYVAMAQTLDVDGARYDLLAYQRIDDSLSQSLTGSSLYGERALRYQLTSSGRHGVMAFSVAQFNATRSDDLLVTGNERPVGRLGTSRLQMDLGHDVHPGDWHVAQDLRVTPGVHFDTATVRAGGSALSGTFDLGEAFYSYGRATLSSDAGLRETTPVNPHLQFDASVFFFHSAPPFPGTLRTYNAGMTWHASKWFNFVSSLTYAHDYGQSFGVGRPQYSASFDIAFRRKNNTGLEIGTIVPFGGVGNMNRQAVLNLRFLR